MIQFVELKCPNCEGELKREKNVANNKYRCKECNALFERLVTEAPEVPIPTPRPWQPVPYDPVTPYWPPYRPII